jgi:ribosome biogenesis GTPase A
MTWQLRGLVHMKYGIPRSAANVLDNELISLFVLNLVRSVLLSGCPNVGLSTLLKFICITSTIKAHGIPHA